MNKLKNLSLFIFLAYLTGCATSGTLVKRPTELNSDETFVLLGKTRFDSISEWRKKDLISFICKNISTGKETECFPQGTFSLTKELKNSKRKRATYSSSEIYKLPLGNYEITKIKYSRAVSTKGAKTNFQDSYFDIPKQNQIPFSLTKENVYLGTIYVHMSFDHTIRPVVQSLRIVDRFERDKSRASRSRKSVFSDITENSEFKNTALVTERVSFKDEYTAYGKWGNLDKHAEFAKRCSRKFFTVIDGELTAESKEGGFFSASSRFLAYGNLRLSNDIICGLYKHMTNNGYEEFKFTGIPAFKAQKIKASVLVPNQQKVLRIPVKFR